MAPDTRVKQICLNRSVLDFMDRIIEPDSRVLEIGGGWSSRWFADRCQQLTVIETNPKWKRTIDNELSGADCDWRTSMLLHSIGEHERFDLVLVDCVPDRRDMSARFAIDRLTVGGWILFDDAQREEHAKTVNYLDNLFGAGIMLFWQEGDVESARSRVTIAWQKSSGFPQS